MGDKFIDAVDNMDIAELAKLGVGMGCVQVVAGLTVAVVTGAATMGSAAVRDAIKAHKEKKEAKKKTAKN